MEVVMLASRVAIYHGKVASLAALLAAWVSLGSVDLPLDFLVLKLSNALAVDDAAASVIISSSSMIKWVCGGRCE